MQALHRFTGQKQAAMLSIQESALQCQQLLYNGSSEPLLIKAATVCMHMLQLHAMHIAMHTAARMKSLLCSSNSNS
jgi:hypothetical protein